MPMSPLPPNSITGALSSQTSPPQFSDEERALLLRLAYQSITSALQNREISLVPPNAHLAEPRGAFTSLYKFGLDKQSDLRGCVGYVLPAYSVYQTVAETARAAAFNDNRFSPVTKEEVADLQVELSILSLPQPIAPDAIEIGRHGLLISHQGRRGLLLPQVPVEHQWDRIQFLEQTCRKAGLAPDAWRNGALVQAFSAEVFGEKIDAKIT
jgi:AmmeMemoRadiSam system protein A